MRPPTPEPSHPPNQFGLLTQRRFGPFFWTQFSGAANDNLFKFAFTVMVTYQLSVGWMPPSVAGLVIGALFILPFLLFSATSGQLADKFDKARTMRFVKDLEVAIMALAAWGLVTNHVAVLLVCTFLMGLHSTLFGPVKFAYLPQVLGPRELTGGNGMVEMGTFVAILLGNVAGGLLVAIPGTGHRDVAIACVSVALLGRAVAQLIPATPATDPELKINWNPITETWRNLQLAHGNRVVFHSLLGISWMWFFGAVFLSQFPSFAKDVLHGNEQVASLLLVLFSAGIGIGSLLCEVLGRRQMEIGLVPLGALGMSVFSIDLYVACRDLPAAELMGVAAFVSQPAHGRVMADLLLLSLFAGLYSVPMYALIQWRSAVTHRARTIAANNILNALFLIASSLLAGALLGWGVSIPEIFMLTGIANALVAFGMFLLVPEYLLRCVAWVWSRLVHRLNILGATHIPADGPAVLVCHPLRPVDALLLMAASPRPIRFVVDQRLWETPVLRALFRFAGAVADMRTPNDPVPAPAWSDAAVLDAATQALRNGELLAWVRADGPAGHGGLQRVSAGAMTLLTRAVAEGLQPPVLPVALSRIQGPYRPRAHLRVGTAQAANGASAQGLEASMEALRQA